VTGIQQMAQNSNVLVNSSNKMVTEMQDIADEPRLVVAKDVLKSLSRQLNCNKKRLGQNTSFSFFGVRNEKPEPH